MGNPRQQRAARNRRAIIPAQPALTPLLAAVVGVLDPTVLRLTFNQLAQPPLDDGTSVPVQLTGIPAIRRADLGTFADSAGLSPDQLTVVLTWAAGGMDQNTRWLIGPFDPAIRTATGGWVAPGEIAPAAGNPVEAAFTISAYDIGAGTAVLNFPGVVSAFVASPWLFYSQPAGVNASAGSWDGVNLSLSGFPALADPPQIQYMGPALAGAGSTFTVPARGIVVG